MIKYKSYFLKKLYNNLINLKLKILVKIKLKDLFINYFMN